MNRLKKCSIVLWVSKSIVLIEMQTYQYAKYIDCVLFGVINL